MKRFYIELPSKEQDNKGILKDILVKNILTRFPFLSVDGVDTPLNKRSSVQYAGPGDFITIGDSPFVDVAAKRKRRNFWDIIRGEKAIIVNNTPKINLYNDFDAAIERLEEYAEEKKIRLDKGYDFKYFGMPVRIYQNFTQIGNHIIPRRNNRDYFDSLSGEDKQIIINVIVQINNIITD